ncbi:PQ-loop domain-containing transporter [Pseudoalteromonas sp. T1lg76]|uniref:PQ-loop domain-containing transporter n=1 Tax=Pseudoalteromonas sp. T1lg76 TaxID=2077103 RepID=UPI000CF7070D|nr:PQ-loop domain-containing transporter [Pseudoalteromonas sp. T1lg76]
MTQYLALFASLILAFSFLPMLNKIRRNRSVSGVSLLMMSFGVAQSLYFIAFNLFFERYAMVLPFVVTGMLSALILYYFIRYNASDSQRTRLLLLVVATLLPFTLLLSAQIDTGELLHVLTFVALLMSSIRVMPQTYKTIRSGDVSNLSARYFILQFIAGVLGLAAELAMSTPSVAHVLNFVMILLTNTAQLACIQYYRQRPAMA